MNRSHLHPSKVHSGGQRYLEMKKKKCIRQNHVLVEFFQTIFYACEDMPCFDQKIYFCFFKLGKILNFEFELDAAVFFSISV